MAQALECSDCEHVQVVGIVPSGIGGFADPQTVCESCGAVGKFDFVPGTKAAMQTQASEMAAVMHRMQGEDHIHRGEE